MGLIPSEKKGRVRERNCLFRFYERKASVRNVTNCVKYRKRWAQLKEKSYGTCYYVGTRERERADRLLMARAEKARRRIGIENSTPAGTVNGPTRLPAVRQQALPRHYQSTLRSLQCSSVCVWCLVVAKERGSIHTLSSFC